MAPGNDFGRGRSLVGLPMFRDICTCSRRTYNTVLRYGSIFSLPHEARVFPTGTPQAHVFRSCTPRGLVFRTRGTRYPVMLDCALP